MKILVSILLNLTLLMFLLSGNASALDFGNNITIPDLMGSGTGWHGAQEDQEVEPGCVGAQMWDVEAFFLKGTTLTMVGGYDFKYNNIYRSGDIFIDAGANSAVYGPVNDGSGSGNGIVANTFGYDYVLDMDFATGTYDVVKLENGSTVTVHYSVNQESNPWRYASGGSLIESGQMFLFGYDSDGLTDDDVGFSGGSHYAVSVSLAFLVGVLGPDEGFITHFTMECGNDNLMGEKLRDFYQPPPVPEPATMALLGTSLIGLAGFCRRKLIKKK